MTKKKLAEIRKLEKIDIVVLSCFGHVGIDYVGNLFDNNDQLIRLPPLSFFRKLKIVNKKNKIRINNYKDKEKLCNILITYFFKKSPLKSYNFFQSDAQKKKFKLYFLEFFKFSKENNFEKKIFLAIHYSFAKLYKIGILNKKFILAQEDRPNYCHNYYKYFKTRYIFVIRDPRAAFSGSFKSQKLKALSKTYGFDRVIGNWLTAEGFVKKFNNQNLYLLKNEKFQGKHNLKKEMKKLSKWLNIDYSNSLTKPTYLGKRWYGDSSYLGKLEQSKPLPKNFYTPENIKKRWKNNLSKKQILDIEMLFFRSIKKYGYSMENKITIINIVRAYYRALFMYKDDYNFFQNIFYTSKNIIRRIMILTNALYASKFIDLD